MLHLKCSATKFTLLISNLFLKCVNVITLLRVRFYCYIDENKMNRENQSSVQLLSQSTSYYFLAKSSCTRKRCIKISNDITHTKQCNYAYFYQVKSVQIRSFFWSSFSFIRIEYGVNLLIQSDYRKIQTRKNCAFGHFSRSVS